MERKEDKNRYQHIGDRKWGYIVIATKTHPLMERRRENENKRFNK